MKPFNFCPQHFFPSRTVLTVHPPKERDRFLSKECFTLKVRLGTYKRSVPHSRLHHTSSKSKSESDRFLVNSPLKVLKSHSLTSKLRFALWSTHTHTHTNCPKEKWTSPLLPYAQMQGNLRDQRRGCSPSGQRPAPPAITTTRIYGRRCPRGAAGRNNSCAEPAHYTANYTHRQGLRRVVQHVYAVRVSVQHRVQIWNPRSERNIKLDLTSRDRVRHTNAANTARTRTRPASPQHSNLRWMPGRVIP